MIDQATLAVLWQCLQNIFKYKEGDKILYDDIELACEVENIDFDSILLNFEQFENFTNTTIIVYI